MVLLKFIVFFIRHVFTPYGIRMYARSRDGDVGQSGSLAFLGTKGVANG